MRMRVIVDQLKILELEIEDVFHIRIDSHKTIKEKMAEKEVIYAGTSCKLNYKKLVKTNVILHSFHPSVLPEKRSSKKAAKKKMTAYRKMTEKMTLLQIPVIVDRAKMKKEKMHRKNGKRSTK